MQKIIILISMMFLLIGCAPENINKEVMTKATETLIVSSTLTPISTETKTPKQIIVAPTSTPYLTPFPTLSGNQTFDRLYKSEIKCDKPCWWGIIPGVSTWTETQQFIEQFSGYVFGVDKSNKPITKSILYDTYVWYVHNPIPGTDSSALVNFDVQNNIVTAIEIGPELVWYFLPVYKLFEEYGQPDKILIDIGKYSIGSTHNYARIYVLYEDKHILLSYSFSGIRTNNLIDMCLIDYPESPMLLWAPEIELNFDFSKLKPLEKFSELNTESFYQEFMNHSNECFEISREAWE